MDTSILLATVFAVAAYSLSRMLFWQSIVTQPSASAYWNRQYLKY